MFSGVDPDTTGTSMFSRCPWMFPKEAVPVFRGPAGAEVGQHASVGMTAARGVAASVGGMGSLVARIMEMVGHRRDVLVDEGKTGLPPRPSRYFGVSGDFGGIEAVMVTPWRVRRPPWTM